MNLNFAEYPRLAKQLAAIISRWMDCRHTSTLCFFSTLRNTSWHQVHPYGHTHGQACPYLARVVSAALSGLSLDILILPREKIVPIENGTR